MHNDWKFQFASFHRKPSVRNAHEKSERKRRKRQKKKLKICWIHFESNNTHNQTVESMSKREFPVRLQREQQTMFVYSQTLSCAREKKGNMNEKKCIPWYYGLKFGLIISTVAVSPPDRISITYSNIPDCSRKKKLWICRRSIIFLFGNNPIKIYSVSSANLALCATTEVPYATSTLPHLSHFRIEIVLLLLPLTAVAAACCCCYCSMLFISFSLLARHTLRAKISVRRKTFCKSLIKIAIAALAVDPKGDKIII